MANVRNSLEEVEEALRDGLVEDERADRVGQPGERPQLGDVVRVLHEPDVEDEVRLERDAELEPEADELERQLVRPDIGRQLRRTGARAAGAATGPRCRGRRPSRPGPDRAGGAPRAIELAIPRSSPSGWRWRVSLIAPDQDLVARLEEDDPRPDPAALERAAHGRQGERRIAGADVEHDRDPGEPRAVRGDELGEVGQQLAGQVVDDGVAEVLEQLGGRGLAAARQPADDDDGRLGRPRPTTRSDLGAASVTARCAG